MLVDEIQETVRQLTAGMPAPRGLPYLGLDHASGTNLATLAHLAGRGIFRKYETVLDLGAGLGAAARWMAAHLGGAAIGVMPQVADALAAHALGHGAAVRFLAAVPTTLPFSAACFTHVWAIESLSSLVQPAAVLAEARRVVRPGGWLGVQELLHDDPGLPGWRRSPAALCALVAASGFVDAQLQDVSADAIEPSARLAAARQRLGERLRSRGGELAALAAVRTRMAGTLAAGTTRVVQVVARRAT